MNEIRNKIQDEFAQLFLKSNTLRHSMIVATGVGKSRIAILILNEIYKNYDVIYIFVNADRLRDYTWNQEIKQFGKSELQSKIKLVNYQTVYKWQHDLGKAFIVADEIDFALSTPAYGTTFYTYKDVPMLGLTGYCAKSKRQELNKVCPVLVEYPYEKAVEDGVINAVNFTFVRFDLSKDNNDIKVEFKKNGKANVFYQSENSAYDYANEAFIKAWIAYEEAFSDLALGKIDNKKFKNIEFFMKMKRQARIDILYNGISSVKVVNDLKLNILSIPNNKVITFSKYTNQADKLSVYTYHSKNSKEVNESNISRFNSGEIRELATCSKIDRGENLKGLNNIILESYNSSDTIISQRRGRGNRLDPKEVTDFYVLLPYYYKKNKDKTYIQKETKAVEWARSMFTGYDLSNAKFIDLRSVKE